MKDDESPYVFSHQDWDRDPPSYISYISGMSAIAMKNNEVCRPSNNHRKLETLSFGSLQRGTIYMPSIYETEFWPAAQPSKQTINSTVLIGSDWMIRWYSVLHLYCTWLAWVKHTYHMHFSFQYLQSTMVLTARLQKNKNMFFVLQIAKKKSNAFSHHLPAQRVLWLCEAGFATKRLILILIGHLGDQRESVSEKIHGPCKAYDKLSRIAGWWLVVLKNISQWDGLSHIYIYYGK